ncbi:tyrosine-type recombinase/integrase [Candidatus Pacearchaeota archaeon]|nr:tyrosine-type recombinase/integrase [Candidatus Pacearchaeota archaeon]
MKVDPYQHKERYLSWKESVKNGIPDISKQNSDIILDYIFDMEHGLNISNKNVKGARSYTRLNSLKQRMIFMCKKFEELYETKDILQIKEREFHTFFTDMRNGVIKRVDGGIYQNPADFVRILKAFWHWHQKVNRKKGIEIYDITQDLDTSVQKPEWVYLTEKQIWKLCESANFKYKTLFTFLFDTGIRAPSELINIKVSDLQNNYRELNIRDEVSKTFGRRIKLMLSSKIIKEYIKVKDLQEDDYLFPIKYGTVNDYLKKYCKKLFGDIKSPAGQKYSEFTMYDFRHCSCCYWLPRYKSESALKYRFGWKRSEKIHYYSGMLGMKDTINEDDMLVDLTKTEIEKKLVKSENEKNVLLDRVEFLEKQMEEIIPEINEMKLLIREFQLLRVPTVLF